MASELEMSELEDLVDRLYADLAAERQKREEAVQYASDLELLTKASLEEQLALLAAEKAKREEAEKELEALKKYPPKELTWLYTHCRAIGMDCKSDSGKWEHDIALFTSNQKAALEKARDAINSVLPLVAIPEKGHKGSCGPWSSCDGACMDHHYASSSVHDAMEAIATIDKVLKP